MMISMEKEVYHIVTAPNEKYLRYMSVLLVSLFETNPGKQFHIYALYSRLEEEGRKKVCGLGEAYGAEIEFVYVNEEKYRELPCTTDRISIETYFRLEIQDLLPKETERALYLDSDMIVCGDLFELYHTDFHDHYIAACGFSTECEQGGEFNAGMILFNMEKMRKDITFETYKKLAETLTDYYMDQGLLNELFGREGTEYVSKQKFNFTCPFYRKFKEKLRKEYPSYSPEEVVVMHFTGPGIRPWEAEISDEEFTTMEQRGMLPVFAQNGMIIDALYIRFLKRWWDYASRTPFYEELKRDMLSHKNKIYFKVLESAFSSKDYRIGNSIMKLPRKLRGNGGRTR